MNKLIGAVNTAPQILTTGALVNFGNVYRKYCKKNACGVKAFEFTGTGITINHSGFYHITITLVATGTETGAVTFQLLNNGIEVPGILSTDSITVAATQPRNFVIDYFVLVDSTCILGNRAVLPRTISVANTGIGSTVTSVVINVEEV